MNEWADGRADDLVAWGRRLRAAGDVRSALDAFNAALHAKGDDPEFLFEAATLLRQLDLQEEALALYDVLAAALPDAVPVLHNRANCLADLGRAEEAMRVFRGILARHPAVTPSWAALGNAAFIAGQPALGTDAYRRAVALEPERAASYVNWAEALVIDAVGLDAHEQAVRLLRRAIALVPDDEALHYNLARSLLSLGHTAEGWAEHEGRLHAGNPNAVVRAIACPRWRGEPLTGRHLFIAGEQGIGDQLWALPFVRAAAAEAGRVTLEVAPKLVALLHHSLPGIAVRPLQVERQEGRWHAVGDSRHGPPDADLHIESGSLPLHLWSRVAGRTATPTLTPDPMLVEHWRAALEAPGPGVRIGVCWRSPLFSRRRSAEYLPVDVWRPIFETLAAATQTRPLHLYCLQHGEVDADLAHVRDSFGLDIHRLPGLDLWDDVHGTAAAMAGMDLVVTALTSIARIGAALGIPTLVLTKSPYVVALADGHDPVTPSLEPVAPAPGRAWPDGVVAEVASRLRHRLAD